jgi:hypothetical protein
LWANWSWSIKHGISCIDCAPAWAGVAHDPVLTVMTCLLTADKTKLRTANAVHCVAAIPLPDLDRADRTCFRVLVEDIRSRVGLGVVASVCLGW